MTNGIYPRASKRLFASDSFLIPLSALPTALWLLVGLIIPSGIFFVFGFWRSDIFGLVRDWNLDQYALALDPFYRALVLRTLALGLTTAAICVPLAYFTAYTLTFSLRRGRNLVLFLIVASMLASYLVKIYAWKTILGPEGAINRGLELLGIINAPLDFLLFGRFAVVVTLIHLLLPLAVLPIFAAMQSVDHDALRASRDLGAGPVVTFCRVLLPLTWNGVIIAFLFVFILATGDYVTPELVGGRGGLMIGRVVNDQFGLTQNWGLGSALSFVLLFAIALTLISLALVVRVGKLMVAHYQPRTSRGGVRLPVVIASVLRRVPWSVLYISFVLILLLFPLILVVIFSFSAGRFAAFPITDLTLSWYRDALGGPTFRDALLTSLKLAALVSTLTITIGLPAAFAISRRTFLLRRWLHSTLLVPLALPGIIIGFSIFTMFIQLGVSPSLTSATLGQGTLLLPLAILILVAALRNFDSLLEEAARDLGCTPLRALWRVTLPILRPTILATALLVFAFSMDEFIITHFTIGADTTLPILIWGLMRRRGITPEVNAIATVVLLASLLFFAIMLFLARWRRTAGRAHPLLPVEQTDTSTH